MMVVFVFCIVRPTRDAYPNVGPQGKKPRVTEVPCVTAFVDANALQAA
jgi:hypothetical protein